MLNKSTKLNESAESKKFVFGEGDDNWLSEKTICKKITKTPFTTQQK